MTQLDKLKDNYPFEPLTDKQSCSLNYLIHRLNHSSIKDLRQQAYVLATIKHETAHTYDPIENMAVHSICRANLTILI